ncbi:MAG: hypothetical protein V5A62_03250 [Haloarculaceae archaeon]
MPAKTGGSHAAAALASLVIGSVLSKYVWTYTPPLAEAAATAGTVLTRVTGTPFPREFAGVVVVMAALSFLWGVIYHVSRHS